MASQQDVKQSVTSPQVAGGRWQFWIDRGGTFTDVVALTPERTLKTAKLLSENPEHYRDAAVEGIRRFLGLTAGQLISSDLVECVKMGTTVATNALLERKGEPTLLVITQGYKDALRIAYQNRPKLFERHIVLPELLYSQVIEAQERVGAHGDVLLTLNQEHCRTSMQAAFDSGLRSVAIVFMHGYRYQDHEKQAAAIARSIGFSQVSVSHEVSPLMKLVGRGDTTVVDAYLSPILRRYVEQVAQQMPGVPLYFMQSSGGLTLAQKFQGKDAILSGPAGGIVGMARTAAVAQIDQVIGFDMGGTSTDVSHYAGEFERAFETQVAGVRMRAPMMSIHTVAAGGGSILSFDGNRFRVGPESAGANPGPASYRRGGPLTVTDANVLVGKLQPQFFPAVFGPQANQELDAAIVRQKFATVAQSIVGNTRSLEAIAEGFIDIAVGAMANAIKRISVARGYDVTRYTLQCFGGAGGQHACLVADALGMTAVLIHPFSGVLSAYGMGLADQSVIREQAIEKRLEQDLLSELNAAWVHLEQKARAELDQTSQQPITTKRRVHLRYEGTDVAQVVTVESVTTQALQAAFEQAYKRQFAFLMQGRHLIAEAVSVECILHGESIQESLATDVLEPLAAAAQSVVPMFTQSKQWQAELYNKTALKAGHTIKGPAIIIEANATTVVEPGWQAEVTAHSHLLLKRIEVRQQRVAIGTTADPVMLEVFNNLFMNIAEQMGLQLQNTAHSVNIKERLDFSCALFDERGNLIANAPHMPVHLGSMGESIKSVVARNPVMQRGDVYVLNDPYAGGTHLPDITVVTPVFDANDKPLFFVASRGHHADVGGLTPGSMPPFSKTIDDEGVRLDNVKLVVAGVLQEAELLARLADNAHPARNPAQNIADLKAQIAANEKGVQELQRMVQQFSLSVVQAYMKHVQDNAEESVRRVIGQLRDGRYELSLDNGAVIKVAVTVNHPQRSARIDFSGTSAQLSNNFNAPRAVCMAAVLYVFRTLVDDEIPLNAGCLKPLEVIIPEGCMLNPREPASVVAGNVETSSCITNALYGALGLMAASQCTMNNFTFGNERYQYYETISGGSGAGDGFAGTSVVQTHMTNSRLTDPEVLEFRFPVRLETYHLREGSGGSGRWVGGMGGVRKVKFLEPMTASILSNGRVQGAFGMAGGQAGAPGLNYIERSNGQREEMGHIGSTQMNSGDVFVIETPGGGGFGVKI